jgi:hypothetical protein
MGPDKTIAAIRSYIAAFFGMSTTVPAAGGEGKIIKSPYEAVSGKRIGPNRRDVTYGGPQDCAIHFLGLWDTVKSYGGVIPVSLPHLRHNPIVRTVRHALALNERGPGSTPLPGGNSIPMREAPSHDSKRKTFPNMKARTLTRCGFAAVTPTLAVAMRRK